MTDLLLTTNPGLEEIVVAECAARLGPGVTAVVPPGGVAGQVLVSAESPPDDLQAAARTLRTIHHIRRLLHTFTLDDRDDPLQQIHNAVWGTDVAELADAPSFRVTATRHGDHPFNSEDAAAIAGGALWWHYGTPVDLTDYAVNVTLDIHDRRAVLAVQLTRAPLSQRHARPFQHRTALRPNVAAALLWLARLPRSAAVLDPFCGSGTILQEAAEMAGVDSAEWTLHGLDSDPEAISGARANLAAAGLAGRVTLATGDARALAAHYGAATFDAVVTNPPYGARLARHWDLDALYEAFLDGAHHVLKPGGQLVLLVWKRGLFRRVVARQGLFAIRHARIVALGGIYPAIYVLTRTAG